MSTDAQIIRCRRNSCFASMYRFHKCLSSFAEASGIRKCHISRERCAPVSSEGYEPAFASLHRAQCREDATLRTAAHARGCRPCIKRSLVVACSDKLLDGLACQCPDIVIPASVSVCVISTLLSWSFCRETQWICKNYACARPCTHSGMCELIQRSDTFLRLCA